VRRRAVLLGEGDLDDLLVAGLGADELLLEALDELAGAELEQVVAALAAGEVVAFAVLALDRALEVDHDEVAVLGRLLDGLQAPELLAQLLDLLVDLLLVDLGLLALDLDLGDVADRGRRAHADLDREGQRLTLGGQVAEVDLGLADGLDPGLVDGLDVPARQRRADGLVEDRLAADALDDDGRRHLALAEARHAQVAAHAAGGLVDAPLDLLRGDLRGDSNPGLGELFDGGLDVRCSGHVASEDSVVTPWPPAASRSPRACSRGSTPVRSATCTAAWRTG
jgi:hypothetical protein